MDDDDRERNEGFRNLQLQGKQRMNYLGFKNILELRLVLGILFFWYKVYSAFSVLLCADSINIQKYTELEVSKWLDLNLTMLTIVL